MNTTALRYRLVSRRAAIGFFERDGKAFEDWAVFTQDAQLKNTIVTFLQREHREVSEGLVDYQQKNGIPVIFIPYPLVLYLKFNSFRFPKFLCFHRKKIKCSSDVTSRQNTWKLENVNRESYESLRKEMMKEWGLS